MFLVVDAASASAVALEIKRATLEGTPWSAREPSRTLGEVLAAGFHQLSAAVVVRRLNFGSLCG